MTLPTFFGRDRGPPALARRLTDVEIGCIAKEQTGSRLEI